MCTRWELLDERAARAKANYVPITSCAAHERNSSAIFTLCTTLTYLRVASINVSVGARAPTGKREKSPNVIRATQLGHRARFTESPSTRCSAAIARTNQPTLAR